MLNLNLQFNSIFKNNSNQHKISQNILHNFLYFYSPHLLDIVATNQKLLFFNLQI
jgi:hypothetical protein